MADVYDRTTGQVVGTTGAVPNAIYRNGAIVGFLGASTTLTRPRVAPTVQTPFRQTTSVVGTEDVRGLPEGTSATQRTATGTSAVLSPQAQIDAAVQKALADWQKAQQPQVPRTDADISKWIFEKFGYMAAYVNHPEVGPILRRAAQLGITSQEQLFGMVSQTTWWRTTNATARQWDLLRSTDPAEADSRISARMAEVNNRASSLGVGLGGDTRSFAENSLRSGWSAEQIVDYLIQRVAHVTEFTEGDLAAIQRQVRAMGTDFLMAVSNPTSAHYARRIASGELTYEAVQAVYAQQAKARFGWLADTIDKGVTPMDYFAPMRDRIAAQLERNPADIDPMDPKWLSMMEVVDAKTGQRRGATEYEIQNRVRATREWYDTESSKELYAGLGTRLLQEAGIR